MTSPMYRVCIKYQSPLPLFRLLFIMEARHWDSEIRCEPISPSREKMPVKESSLLYEMAFISGIFAPMVTYAFVDYCLMGVV